MALVLEDGTGLADANAYADQTIATAAHAKYLVDTSISWDAANSDDKDDALIAATAYMDLVYKFLGERANPDVQALDFPRTGIRCDGVVQPLLPLEIQEACSLLAVLHTDQIAGTNPQGLFGGAIIGKQQTGAVRKKRVKVGSGIEWERQYSGSAVSKAAAEAAIPVLSNLINCFLEDRGRVGAGRLARM